MDVHMPIMDGFATCAAIREIERAAGAHTPIVAMTAEAMKGDRERCLEAGMDGYIAKPVQQAALLEAIQGLVIRTPADAISDELSSGTKDPGEESPGPGNHRVFDQAAFLDRLEGNKVLAKQLAVVFLNQDSPQFLADIRGAIAHRDRSVIASAAHALKGAVGEFGATAAFDALQVLESRCLNADLVDVEEHYTIIENEVQKLARALQEFAHE